MWIRIWKEKLFGQIFTFNDVSKNVNLNKILKFDLGYKELGHIKKILDYLDQFQKDVFTMIRQLRAPFFW
jgi:hypothetical protein